MTTASGQPESDPAGVAGFRPPGWPETLPPEIAELALQTFVVPANRENAVTLDLTDAQTDRLIDQMGRQSDQEHNFKKWLLVAGCLIFCFVVLVITGIIIYMVGQGETALLAPIFSGIGGAIAGIGGTLGFVALRQWRQ